MDRTWEFLQYDLPEWFGHWVARPLTYLIFPLRAVIEIRQAMHEFFPGRAYDACKHMIIAALFQCFAVGMVAIMWHFGEIGPVRACCVIAGFMFFAGAGLWQGCHDLCHEIDLERELRSRKWASHSTSR